jgi:ribosomal protein S18 acetylase RimI-like enzyme
VTYSIRHADLGDAGGIAAVQVASWRTTYPGIVAQGYIDQLSVEKRTTAWERAFRGEGGDVPDVVVAIGSDGAIVGFASGGRIREPQPGFDAELYAIYLLEDTQRRGVGKRILSEWATLAIARGLTSAVVRVLAANPARRFYEHLGARRIKGGSLTIGEQQYAEEWYGWDDLKLLLA